MNTSMSPTSQLAVGSDPMRLIAFYLPQFHPIPENDQWWGPGFTEWTNVTRARPLFRGHQQPHLPSDLGFYDLRLPEARQAQADLAREYGISGFCYYHYWFSGRRLLERPFNEVLASREPDFPFCLCWANERWTRTWDGGEHCVLMDQTYSAEDDLAHIRWLCEAFRDPRYIRVEGRPLFLVYRLGTSQTPCGRHRSVREEALRQGLDDLFLCRVESHQDNRVDPHLMGFDAAVEFVPEVSLLGSRVGPTGLRQLDRVLRKARIARRHEINRVYSYETLAAQCACQTELRLRTVPLRDPVVGQQCPSQLGCRDHGRLVPRTLPRMARRDCPPGVRQSPRSPGRLHQRMERMGRREPPRALPALGSRLPGSDPGGPPGRLATDRWRRADAAVVLPW